MMQLATFPIAIVALALLVSSPATAQSPPPPFLPPTPAPAPAPHYVNLTELLALAGPFDTFLSYLQQTKVIETFQNQANNTKQGITIFVPKNSAFSSLKKSDLANLTEDQLRTLLLYHAFPKYYSLSDFRRVSNPMSTFAGGQNALNITDSSGLIHVISTWSSPQITSSVYSTAPVAIYELNGVLLPLQLFSTDPPLAPAPAPATESGKPSDLAPSKDGSSSAPKSSESSTTGGSSCSTSVDLVNYMLLALSGCLMLIL